MFWIYCGLFVLVIAVPGFSSNSDSTSKREADYTLDDSFWNEETPVGERKLVLHNDSEVERLLRNFRQNEELLQNIGGHSYQIIYPVQLRHHEKMGISTREAGSPKFPQRVNYGDDYQNGRARARTGKHFHRTSILIKAFTHKFRLDLELNTQLLAPNIIIKHYLPNGAEHLSKQGIEHCYYHGTVKDYPGASAAFHTCNGVSGVIHLGNETFIIHPFYGGDLSKHPHIIFGARTKANKGCANSGNYEWRVKSRTQRFSYMLDSLEDTSFRYKRDVREATKYIETAVLIDKAMFDKRNGSSRLEIVHDAIQVANIADLYFRTLNTRISVIYIETWQGTNQASIENNMDVNHALMNFNDYSMRKLHHILPDSIQLLTGETFEGGESGMALPKTVCGQSSVGISVDLNIYEPHLLAGTMAHMIGHNIGMIHDDGRDECLCRDWHGCIMAQSIVGLENVQPYKFSECSKADYISALKNGLGFCLLNKPNEVQNGLCGNRKIDESEQCDCGSLTECREFDPCCDPYTCKLTMEAECASGPCCDNCKLRARGVVCREATNECDLPEECTGETGQCPTDVYKKNGSPCYNDGGICFNGVCPALNLQCEQVWGYGGKAADTQCFEEFNSKGSINGHCGTSESGHYIKCERKNVLCGSLQCQMGAKQPTIEETKQFSRTVISEENKEYECKTTSGPVEKSQIPGMGLVLDGTSCGGNMICINQTCTSISSYINPEKCPSNDDQIECSGNGVCTSANKCYCYLGWGGPDCSIQQDITTIAAVNISTTLAGKSDPESKMEKKETPYGGNNNNLSTLAMVFILVGVVKGVFICFALMAVCYRRKSTIQKYDPPYSKKPMQKNYSGASTNHHSEVDALDSVNKFLGFGSMPSYSRGETQRVLFRSQNNVATADGIRLKEHKPQMTRLALDDEDGGTGAEEVVSFIDLPPNSLTKLPEKGILKKHGGYGITGGGISEVERTLNSLNGYHENIIEALRNAASHRGLTTVPSGSGSLLSEDVLRKSLSEHGYGDSYRKHSDSQDNIDNQDDEDEEEMQPTCDPIRIRTLEDIIRQLEHHSTRHMSPSGSEDIRISENEGDRHYRIDSSVCSESSQGSRRCSRVRDDDSRFVYGRYRQPSSRCPYSTHQHAHQHSHQMHEEEGIYETADPDRGANRGETPDSESDAFIQAQQQLARWTSEEGIQHRPPQQPAPLPTSTMQPQYHQQQLPMDHPHLEQRMPKKQRSYYPSPSQSDNGLGDDKAGNAQSQQNFPDVNGINVNHLPNVNKCSLDDNCSLDCIINNGSPKELNTNNVSDNENTALLPPSHFPEYKH